MSLSDGIEVPPLSRLKIRSAAGNARKVLGLTAPQINAEKLLENLYQFGVVCDVFDHESAPVAASVEACWVPQSQTLYIRDRVYDDMCAGGSRALFTIGHELGHIVLAHQHTHNRMANTASLPAYRNSEWQADCFAAEFTMPLEVIRSQGLTSPEQISATFGVSMKAATIRLTNLVKHDELRRKP